MTELHAIDHPTPGVSEESLSFTINYLVTDADGDTADGSMAISVNDDTPTTSANAAVQLDDDALTGGNPGGTGDVHPDRVNATGTLAIATAPTAPARRCCWTAGRRRASADSLSPDGTGTTSTISQVQDGSPVDVLRVTLTDTSSGDYTVDAAACDRPSGRGCRERSAVLGELSGHRSRRRHGRRLDGDKRQ